MPNETRPTPAHKYLTLAAYWPNPADVEAMGRRIADRSAVADIECEGVRDSSRPDGRCIDEDYS